MAAHPLARESVTDFRLRPLERQDLTEAAQAAAAGFGFDISHRDSARRFEQRLAHLLDTDPDGCFVAERNGRVIGIAEAMCRERLWCLSMLAVDPAAQSLGAGRALLERTLQYARGTDCGLIVASDDQASLRGPGSWDAGMSKPYDVPGVIRCVRRLLDAST